MVTLKDVAKIAGVSTSTVSRVMSGKNVVSNSAKERVEKAVVQTGYIPNQNAQALAKKDARCVGVVTPDLSIAFFGTLAAGVIDAAVSLGVTVDICSANSDNLSNLKAVDTLRRRGFKNIILDDVHSKESEIVELAKHIPGLVIINRFIPQIAERCICVDNVTGGYIAASHLLSKGHRRIAFLTSSSKITDPIDRIHGAKTAMSKYGLDIDDGLIFENEPTIAGGRYCVSELLSEDKAITAIIAYNDEMAVGAMNELQDRGISIPREFSIVGFDNLAFSNICRPSLTTMHYPIREMAGYALNLSLELTDGESDLMSKSHKFVPKIIERNSVIEI